MEWDQRKPEIFTEKPRGGVVDTGGPGTGESAPMEGQSEAPDPSDDLQPPPVSEAGRLAPPHLSTRGQQG